ncbi:CpaF family protein [Archangium lansingense]|uniref:ATPase, T2SS/T4P/T4SS family n=1 Tax=Archangium lansingense TaxID=2995310 RepID=A0ABT3ZX11_9BACT|nr:ATPase, T2SS/T4P/T4SS family [Archangium lansinium]MCY1073933.1 ATPase, T2SS/T4P/T4SS family [Archangium lansinium]
MSMYSESLRAFLKPVLPYLDDPSVSEIMINGPTDVWIERKGKVSKTDATFTEEGLIGAARNMAQFVGRLLNDERPRLDARLPDGSRIHVVIPPIARKGTTISIRKFFKDKLTIESLIKFKSMTPQMARLIDAGIHTKLNMLVSGGTGSGKTTLLNIVSSLIPDEERILTIEDSAELQLNQSHLVPFESRPPDKFGKGGVDMGDLLNSALRLRPDRIVVGEVRGGEAFYLVQAMNTGHGGSLATTHANTPTDTLRRIESLCLMSGIDLPMVAIRAQVASAINFIVCCERLHDGSRKTIALSEVLPLNEKGEYRTQDIFVFTPVTKDEDGHILGYHAPTGIVPHFVARARAYGFSDLDDSFFDPATYGVPPPPSFHAGESYSVRWAPSLKHRERGEQDPASYKKEWLDFEQRLKDEALEAKGGKPAAPPVSPPVQVQVPANLPVAAPKAPEPPARSRTSEVPAARTGGPALRPNLPSNKPAPPVDDDKTPPPTRNPFASEEDDALGAPRDDEPSVQVSADLLADELETQGRGIPPPRPARPSTPPPRPATATSSRPAVAAPARRPAPPAPARPPPPVPSEDLEDDDAPRELDSSEKTHIKPMPEKPRR